MVDKALCTLLQLASEIKSPEEHVFGFLIRASGGMDAIIRAYKLEQYDHKGLLSLLSSNSAKSFPILSVMVNEAKLLPRQKVDIQKVYGLDDGDLYNRNTITGAVISKAADQDQYDDETETGDDLLTE